MEKVKSFETDSWTGDKHKIGEVDFDDGRGGHFKECWATPTRPDINEAYLKAIQKRYSNNKSAVTSEKLYFERRAYTSDGVTSISRYYRVIVDGKELWDVEVAYTSPTVPKATVAIPVCSNIFASK